ncbi:MAG: sulfatase/phosphatase domain-containing protein, partial [Planctomycetota bacterium]
AVPVSGQGGDAKPNLLFIMADDHAFQAMSCYGSRINRTPNLDRLARRGVLFEQSFCTNSICAPSRAVLLTGKYSHLNGVIDNSRSFDGGQVTFPKLLRSAGYETALFGKWHLKSDPTGFDYWKILPGQGHYYNPDFIEMGEKKRETGYVTDLITDDCLKWLNERDQEKPFCVLLHHKAPHRNWMPDEKHLNMYRNGNVPIPDTLFDDYATRSDAARQQEMTVAEHMYLAYDLKLPPGEEAGADTKRDQWDRRTWADTMDRLTPGQREAWEKAYRAENEAFSKAGLEGRDLSIWKYERYIKDYLRCVASVDDNIGRVLDALDASGLSENTVVVYTSDQGFYLGEHGWFDKRFMYEESLRMPLIVSYPSEIAPGVNGDDMALNLDFAPTFLDYAGVAIPKEMQGNSLRPVLAGKTPESWRKSIYYHYYEYPAVHQVKRHYGVRTSKYKLIHFYHDIDAWELYDLKNDPHELNNVHGDAAYAGVMAELKTELQRLRKKYKDEDDREFMPRPGVCCTHLATGCPVVLKYPFSEKYPGGSPHALTDGLCSPDKQITTAEYRFWQGFEQNDLHATIDLGKSKPVSRISAGFLRNEPDWIFLPLSVIFALSEDGKDFKTVAEMLPPSPDEIPEASKHTFSREFTATDARYIRVHAKNRGVCPEGHEGAGGLAWIFADEIVVN